MPAKLKSEIGKGGSSLEAIAEVSSNTLYALEIERELTATTECFPPEARSLVKLASERYMQFRADPRAQLCLGTDATNTAHGSPAHQQEITWAERGLRWRVRLEGGTRYVTERGGFFTAAPSVTTGVFLAAVARWPLVPIPTCPSDQASC